MIRDMHHLPASANAHESERASARIQMTEPPLRLFVADNTLPRKRSL